MNFLSDNCYGAAPEIVEALTRANEGADTSYGGDAISARLTERVSELFERAVAVFPVISGTAANALSLATLVPPHGAVLCHATSHIVVDECGAVEFFSHGARLVGIEGRDGKLVPEAVRAALARFTKGDVHHPQPAALSITNATELGTFYRAGEIAALSQVARAAGLKLHMDGARFANAVAALGSTPAELSWKAGVDVLCFGATKNGAPGAEAVIFFDPADARDFEYHRKKSGHLVSKMRFLSAQIEAALEHGRWLDWAGRANALAAMLARGLEGVTGARIVHPVETNAVFVSLDDRTAARLRDAGARFYDWGPPESGRRLVRLVTSFATPEADVAKFIAIASS